MWFIGVEVEQETSAPPPKKILDPPLNYIANLKLFVLRRCLSNRVLTERQKLIGENDYIIFTTHQYDNIHASCNVHPHNLW